jgi:putative restriction endonuclease
MKMWIEMSRDEEHGGDEWGFTKCIWAPTYKKSEGEDKLWLFWDNVNKVKTGDIVFHLRGKGQKAEFVGCSIAKTDGHETLERPLSPGSWAYCKSFYRAFLSDYMKFNKSINLYQLFEDKEVDFRRYYEQKAKPRNIFYTIQSNRLQCLNGGYLSEVDEMLLAIILDNIEVFTEENSFVDLSVPTSVAIKQIKVRVGHARFSANVKSNYNNRCCFPECRISDRDFLVASHIARWADNSEKRGDTSNGLCLCPIHDKAFELGYFSLDDNFRICVEKRKDHSQIFKEYISRYIGMTISKGHVEPDREALAEHRRRSNISDIGSN